MFHLSTFVPPQSRRIGSALFIVAGALLLTILTLTKLAAQPLAHDGSSTRYVAPGGSDSSNDCSNSAQPCASLQHAIDQATSSNTIKLAAGIYTNINSQGGLSQIGYIDKSLTIRGGYTTPDFDVSNPSSNPSILDAQALGRGIVITGGGTVTVESLTVQNGDASGLGGGINAGGCADAGGGIFVDGTSVMVLNTTIYSSTACNGGGFYAEGVIGLDIDSSAFNQNSATRHGGGFYIYQSSNITMTNSIFSQNVANIMGSGMKHCGGGRLHISNNIQMADNQISENLAANNGGGLCLEVVTTTLLIRNQIYDNKRLAGFAGHGGGVFVNGGEVTFADNDIFKNSGVDLGNLGTSYLGGAVFVSNATVTFTADRLLNNVAVSGGGLAITNSTVTATNLVIVGNWVEAETTGSGFYQENSTVTLNHPTIANNDSSNGTSIFVTGTSTPGLTITNAIIADHAVGISNTTASKVIVAGVLWYANSSANHVGDVMPTNEVTGDPAFAADGYHLGAGSAAIDQALPTAVIVDVDFESRPGCGLLPDLGADEHTCLYLPLILRSSN